MVNCLIPTLFLGLNLEAKKLLIAWNFFVVIKSTSLATFDQNYPLIGYISKTGSQNVWKWTNTGKE